MKNPFFVPSLCVVNGGALVNSFYKYAEPWLRVAVLLMTFIISAVTLWRMFRESQKPTVLRAPRRRASRLPLVALAGPLSLVLCQSCSFSPLRGGSARVASVPGAGLVQSLKQGQNAAQPSRSTQETITVRALPGTNSPPYIERVETRATVELGAAQKDTGREVAAKLSSLKGIVWLGVLLFLFGVASAVYPPLKVVIGSVTTSAAIAAGGLALIILPTLIVGNELLILGGVALGVGAWFLAHRHGVLKGQAAAS